MRIALYWTPDKSTPLNKVAADWFKSVTSTIPDISDKELQTILSAPNHYGFHATIKPPFRLKPAYRLEDVERELTIFTKEEQNRTFPLPHLEIARIRKFFCLKTTTQSEPLERFATAAVQRFDHFRKPAGESEIAHRRASGLTARQDKLLLKWGYPYVFDEFRFHLTLTGNILNPDWLEPIHHELSKRFTPALQLPYCFNSISLFLQQGNQPFTEYRRWNLYECASIVT